jgi:hypothetical protein
MPTFTLQIDKLNPDLLDLIERIDCYQWSLLYAKSVIMDLARGSGVADENSPTVRDDTHLTELRVSAEALAENLLKYPVLMIDPTLDNVIEDTNPDLSDLRLPFPSFFIDKKFVYEDGVIMGISVEKQRETSYLTILEACEGDKKLADQKYQEFLKNPLINNEIPDISFHTVFVDLKKKDVIFIISGSDEVFDPTGLPNEYHVMLKRILEYCLNVGNLIITKSDLQNPVNPKKEVRLIPRYNEYNKKSSEQSRFSIIRVFGTMREYVTSYNKARRQHGNKLEHGVLVRGHWRHLKAARYKEKKVIWIAPFIRGMDKGLYSRLIKVVDGR